MSEADKRAFEADEVQGRGEPGFGTALIAVGVILVTIAVLSFLIYMLMIAIRPIEARTGSTKVEQPVSQPEPQSQSPTRAITPPTPK